MLTLTELKNLLVLNEYLTVQAMRTNTPETTKRLFELTLHRSIIKDTMIAALEMQLTQEVYSEIKVS